MSDTLNEDKITVETPYEQTGRRTIRRDVFPGIFILIVGVLLFLRQSGVVYPYWFFTWPVLLIAIGIFSGLKHNFRGGGWLIPILIGFVFLADRALPGLALHAYIWPLLIIGVGLVLIVRPKRGHHWRRWQEANLQPGTGTQPFREHYNTVSDNNDYIDTTAILGGIKKIVLSKTFKGGDITNFMGGTEINLTQADIQGVITIDATNIFGGTKLIVPSSWDVQSNVVTIFGGVDDKRQILAEVPHRDKILKLDGTCIFGGIEIKSY